MKLRVRVKLNLRKAINSIIIRYNTFEKVSWDRYLATSISLRATSEKMALEYIDDISGNGSLNSHFRKIYDSVSTLSKEDKIKVLESNMYPVLKIDNSHKYEFFPDLNMSVFENKSITGDLGMMNSFHPTLMSDPQGVFSSSSVDSGEIINSENIYNILFDNQKILCEIARNCWVPITEEFFDKNVSIEVKKLDTYKGNIIENPDGESWNVLTNSMMSNLRNSESFFFQDGDFYMITNERLKRIRIGKIHGILIYSEDQYEYSKNNNLLCERVLKELIDSGQINNFRTKALVQILSSVNSDSAQEVINYILNRKNSAEIAQIGMDLLAKGFERNWSEGALDNFKKIAKSEKNLTNLYNIAPTLDYSIEELLVIHNYNTQLLSTKHRELVNEHLQKEEEIRDACSRILGEVSASGNREKTKILPNSSQLKRYKDLINQLIAHSQTDISTLTGQKLKEHYDKVQELKMLNIGFSDEIRKAEKKLN